MTPAETLQAREPERQPSSAFANRYSWAAVALLALHAVLAWLARRPGILTEHDDAVYVVLGRALHTFQYRELFRIDRPVHLMYPPLYPSLLSVWSAIGGEGFNWLVILSIASSVGALALIFSALRAAWGPRVALACLAAMATNPSLIDSAGGLATEAPFTFFEAMALWTFTREPARPRLVAVAIAASLAAALTRSIGVTLIAGMGLFWLWRHRFVTLAIYTVVATLTVGLWLGWTATSAEKAPGKSYIADASAARPEQGLSNILIDRLTNKAPYALTIYLDLPGPAVSTRAVHNVFGMLIVTLALLAGSVRLWATWPVAFLYLAAYGGLLLLWPWPVPRFIVPVLLLIVPTTLAGIGRLVSIFRPRWEASAIVVASGILVLNGLWTVHGVIDRQKGCVPGAPLPSRACLDEDQASFFSAVQYIREHVSPDAIFLSGKPATLYYYTSHQVVSLTQALSRAPSEFLPFLQQQRATHVLLLTVMPFTDGVPSYDRLALGPMLRANCDRLHLEASFPPRAYLFRLPAADEHPDPIAACRAVDTYLETVRRDGRHGGSE
jgi:hypothetical protein